MKKADPLDALRAHIEQKREAVARLEQELADLTLEIAAFERVYNTEVEPFQAELEATELHIAEYELRNELLRFRGDRLNPSQLEAEVELQLRARQRPSEACTASPPHTRQAQEDPSAQITAPDETEPIAKAERKSLYRELAKRYHPDLAADDAEREARGARMAAINEAYARGDLETLRRLAAGSDLQPKLPPTLAELLAEQDRLDALIVRLRQDIAEMNRDPLMLLKLDVTLARHDGRDLLAEMATDLHIKIVERRGTLNRLIAEFRELVEQVGLG
jgi:hypothetical protein